jgi:hypothetical protein
MATSPEPEEEPTGWPEPEGDPTEKLTWGGSAGVAAAAAAAVTTQQMKIQAIFRRSSMLLAGISAGGQLQLL